MIDVITDLLATPHHPTVSDVQLEWAEKSSASYYYIYRSNSVRGGGFNFSSPYDVVLATGTGKVLWVDVGAYADASDYTWVVRAVIGGNEVQTPSNPAWKLVYTLRQGTGMAGADQNYISLPYRLNIAGSTVNTAAALMTDMRARGSPTNSVTSVNRWNQTTGLWETRTMVAGINFPLKAGEGYRVIINVAQVIYKIVGAHDPYFTYNLSKVNTTYGGDNNYISLPYHYSFAENSARGLITNLRSAGSPVNGASSVNRWNQDISIWEARIAIAGTNFILKPGECYRVVVTVPTVTWQCPVATLGG